MTKMKEAAGVVVTKERGFSVDSKGSVKDKVESPLSSSTEGKPVTAASDKVEDSAKSHARASSIDNTTTTSRQTESMSSATQK